MPSADSNAEALLKAAGPGVSKHMKDLLKKIATTENAEKAFHALEVYSRNLKSAPAKPKSCFDHPLTENEIEMKKTKTEIVKKIATDPKDEEGNLLPICALPNFCEENDLLNWAGVGFGSGKANSVMNSLRHFAATTEGLKKVRFWGKICGSEADYYVAEGQLEAAGEEDPENPMFEPLGTGANTFAYWVTNSITTPSWVRLPDVTPSAIVAARSLKKVFSGNLEAKVVSMPFFGEPEKVLLRAQIARITAETVLNVQGYLSVSEDDGSIAETEEFVFPSQDVLKQHSGWMHCVPHILKTGRCSYLEIDAEAEPEAYEAQELKKLRDPMQDQLRGINTRDWAIRAHAGAALSVRSLKYPGAVCVTKGSAFCNVYVGYGLKRGQDFFYCAPPDVQDEPADVPECAEPTPADGPPAPPAEE
ncbi:unnamed protein product [Amoebophrya sp. A25]|nr:unnamed protein product [Amoebophrya sp. A25]|eukprot:GSA25T00016661001.1